MVRTNQQTTATTTTLHHPSDELLAAPVSVQVSSQSPRGGTVITQQTWYPLFSAHGQCQHDSLAALSLRQASLQRQLACNTNCRAGVLPVKYLICVIASSAHLFILIVRPQPNPANSIIFQTRSHSFSNNNNNNNYKTKQQQTSNKQ